MLEAKPLKYKQLPGISEKQLNEHHDVLYAGYVKKYNEITEKLKSTSNEGGNVTYSDLRELQLEKSFAFNGAKLHEMYFDNMTPEATECNGKIKEMIEAKWGSVDAWAEQFAATGLCSRGWVILAYDRDTKEIDTYLCDVHNQGGVWNSIPLLIMDVYEHAYFIDYATTRKDYVSAFMKVIDWSVVNNRIENISN
jgi:Fe-Mn family superoxide dismutase